MPFGTLFCIPIERPVDTDNKPINNDDAFKRCNDHLSHKGSIFIAIEGASFIERHLRELKTGAARMAFAAEKNNDFALNLRILPIGVTYENPLASGGRLVVNIGETISVADFRKVYENSPKEAVLQLTDRIKESLQNLTVDCPEANDEALLQKIEMLSDSTATKKLDTISRFYRSQQQAQRIGTLRSTQIDLFKLTNQRINDIFSTFPKKAAAHRAFLMPQKVWKIALNGLLLFLTLPIFLYGFLHHFILVLLAELIIAKSGLYPGYFSTVRYVAGLFLMPIIYAIQVKIAASYLPLEWLVVYALSLPISGLLARKWWKRGEDYISECWAFLWQQKHPHKLQKAIENRGWILEKYL